MTPERFGVDRCTVGSVNCVAASVTDAMASSSWLIAVNLLEYRSTFSLVLLGGSVLHQAHQNERSPT